MAGGIAKGLQEAKGMCIVSNLHVTVVGPWTENMQSTDTCVALEKRLIIRHKSKTKVVRT